MALQAKPAAMDALRTVLRRHRGLAFVLIALSLCLKMALPTGYMIAPDARTFTVQICHDASGEGPALKITVPFRPSGNEAPGKPVKGECPYGSLSMASLGGADAVLLALAMAFIIALGFAPIRFALAQRFSHVRPPLRGPPALI